MKMRQPRLVLRRPGIAFGLGNLLLRKNVHGLNVLSQKVVPDMLEPNIVLSDEVRLDELLHRLLGPRKPRG